MSRSSYIKSSMWSSPTLSSATAHKLSSAVKNEDSTRSRERPGVREELLTRTDESLRLRPESGWTGVNLGIAHWNYSLEGSQKKKSSSSVIGRQPNKTDLRVPPLSSDFIRGKLCTCLRGYVLSGRGDIRLRKIVWITTRERQMESSHLLQASSRPNLTCVEAFMPLIACPFWPLTASQQASLTLAAMSSRCRCSLNV